MISWKVSMKYLISLSPISLIIFLQRWGNPAKCIGLCLQVFNFLVSSLCVTSVWSASEAEQPNRYPGLISNY